MKDERFKPLGKFLSVCPKTAKKKKIKLNIGRVSLSLKIDDLLRGEADLKSLVYCANPIGEIISAIAATYGIDEILLKPYEAAVVANPIVVPPQGWSPEDKPGGMEHRSSGYGADYYYPKQHLVGASLYPVFFQVAADKSTPPHTHPGTETLMVMNGNADEVFIKDKPGEKSHRICAGKVLHYSGEILHCTVNRNETDVFQAWAFRELEPIHADTNRKQTKFMVGILGGLLRTMRLVNRKDIHDVAKNNKKTITMLKNLENGNQVSWLDIDQDTGLINEDKLKELGKMYGIGEELISVFSRKPSRDPVEASSIWPEGGNINPANMDYNKPQPGIFFYWPESILVGSTIHPVLLQLAPFSRTRGHSHPGSEILLIIEGEAKVEFTENQTVIKSIKAGQLAQFDGSWHHSVENIGGSFLKAWILREFRLT